MQCRHQILLKSGILVPCGKCPACRANYRCELVFRIQQEYLANAFSIFVTLTYNDEHLPKNLSVNKEDVQKFHKRLRKHFPSGELRFFLISEYGDKGKRPHYHGLYFFKTRQDYNAIYDIFVKSWNLGFIKFGEVELGSILYCTKYCLKGSDVPEGRAKNFRLMSKMNGGIGYSYLEKMSNYHIEKEQFSFVSANGRVCRMPRYYRTKLTASVKAFHPERVEEGIEAKFNKMREDFNQRYIAWLKRNGLRHCKDSMQKFNDFLARSCDAQDELTTKNVKPQNLF